MPREVAASRSYSFEELSPSNNLQPFIRHGSQEPLPCERRYGQQNRSDRYDKNAKLKPIFGRVCAELAVSPCN